MAIAVPPRAGGSWRGTTHFLWCASGGLYALKNPNEGYELKRIGTWRDVSLVVVVVVGGGGGGGVLTCHSTFGYSFFFLFSFQVRRRMENNYEQFVSTERVSYGVLDHQDYVLLILRSVLLKLC